MWLFSFRSGSQGRKLLVDGNKIDLPHDLRGRLRIRTVEDFVFSRHLIGLGLVGILVFDIFHSLQDQAQIGRSDFSVRQRQL
ncbi:MAG: hypothetical protein JWO91_3086 [Acidobacteriaceae bacterium]|nr:hypothetical protein [Acidobacteriaceae bacterium]